jgi:hypothetical protein
LPKSWRQELPLAGGAYRMVVIYNGTLVFNIFRRLWLIIETAVSDQLFNWFDAGLGN